MPDSFTATAQEKPARTKREFTEEQRKAPALRMKTMWRLKKAAAKKATKT